MKTALAALLVATVFSFTASAVPSLRVDVELLERSAAGDKTLTRPMFITTSGREAVIQSGKFEYKVTPVLLEDGTVDVSAALAETEAGKSHQVVDQRVKAKLGCTTEVQVDDLVFRTTTTLLK